MSRPSIQTCLLAFGLVVCGACGKDVTTEFPVCEGDGPARFSADCGEQPGASDTLDDPTIDDRGDETGTSADVYLVDVVDSHDDDLGGDSLDLELDTDQPDNAEVPVGDSAEDVAEGPCPPDMVQLDDICMDPYEAPNRYGALPLVMYHFFEAEAWCEARGKRLCFDDEWTDACQGEAETQWPYGDDHDPGICNDEETWITYDQDLLNLWPWNDASTPDVESLEELFDSVRDVAPYTVAHLEDLYQGEGSGTNPGCTNETGVYDLTGNVEEWTRRRDGGEPDLHGNLKGRYWHQLNPENWTCQGNLRGHGDYFRFYEIGFRCCLDY